MSKFTVVITPQAKTTLRKTADNEVRTFRNALREIGENPIEDRMEIMFLSTRGKYDAYRFRSSVGFVVYLVENRKKEIVIIDIQPFRKH
jgi:mRNA-degrading endonuclease RelE of RelBE toxin-antitoxin system